MKLYLRVLLNNRIAICDDDAGFEGRGDSTAAVVVDGKKMIFNNVEKAINVKNAILLLLVSKSIVDIGDETRTILKPIKGSILEEDWWNFV